MIEIFIATYLSLVLILGLVSLLTINEKLRNMSAVRIVLFLLLQPVLAVRFLFEKNK